MGIEEISNPSTSMVMSEGYGSVTVTYEPDKYCTGMRIFDTYSENWTRRRHLVSVRTQSGCLEHFIWKLVFIPELRLMVRMVEEDEGAAHILRCQRYIVATP